MALATRGLANGVASAIAVAALLASAPSRADSDPWLGRDKALHFGVSAAVAGATYGVTVAIFEPRYAPLALGATVALTVGIEKELHDLAGFGDPSWKDLAWDAIGTAVGLGLAYVIDVAVRGVSDAHPALGAPAASTSPAASAAPHVAGSGLVLRF